MMGESNADRRKLSRQKERTRPSKAQAAFEAEAASWIASGLCALRLTLRGSLCWGLSGLKLAFAPSLGSALPGLDYFDWLLNWVLFGLFWLGPGFLLGGFILGVAGWRSRQRRFAMTLAVASPFWMWQLILIGLPKVLPGDHCVSACWDP